MFDHLKGSAFIVSIMCFKYFLKLSIQFCHFIFPNRNETNEKEMFSFSQRKMRITSTFSNNNVICSNGTPKMEGPQNSMWDKFADNHYKFIILNI